MILTRKKSKLLLTTLIFTIIHMSLIMFVAVALVFNLFGVVDILNVMIGELSAGVTIDYYLSTYYIELALSFIINLSCAKLYYKGYKYGAFGEVFGKRLIMNAIIQLLFSAFIPGVFALITGIAMSKQKKKIVVTSALQEANVINETKLAAMSEAVTRLKELRESGAISEEEYYANINKILES